MERERERERESVREMFVAHSGFVGIVVASVYSLIVDDIEVGTVEIATGTAMVAIGNCSQ